MALIEGANNPGNRASVTAFGQLRTEASSTKAQTEAAIEGTAYNVNSGILTLTNDAETPIAYFENTFEVRDIIIDNILLELDTSGAGSTDLIEVKIVSAPTNGTIITSGSVRNVANLNLASTKPLNVVALAGATGLTLVGGEPIFQFLIADGQSRVDLCLDSLVLPRGSSFAIVLTPGNGSTSLKVQTGFSIYLREEV